MSSNCAKDAVRIDKWLWAARLFKTRALAAAAVDGGKVHLNGARTKPAKRVKQGDLLLVHRGDDELTLRILALSDQRGPARMALLLYGETLESQAARAERKARDISMPPAPHPDERPSKKDRRALARLSRPRY